MLHLQIIHQKVSKLPPHGVREEHGDEKDFYIGETKVSKLPPHGVREEHYTVESSEIERGLEITSSRST